MNSSLPPLSPSILSNSEFYIPQFSGRPLSASLSDDDARYNLDSSRAPSDKEMAATPATRPLLRQSNSFSAGDRPTGAKPTFASSSKRNSDEAKPPGVAKKSGGFSKFMNSVLGSPKRVEISGPSNPVHLTHVGFNFVTGEFTVRELFRVYVQAFD